jgi:thiamine pyrophosphate-dependent acetolactate synthase large subunit-like protein
MAQKKEPSSAAVNRRAFLAGSAAAGIAVGAAAVTPAGAQNAASEPATQRGAPPPTAEQLSREHEPPTAVSPSSAPGPGADFMVDVIKSLNIPYVFSNSGSSFQGLQESVVNYAHNQAPEFITCMHEESSVAMAHGYAKAAGHPAMVFCHGTVGLQHAAMALYNAWCDRVPLIAVLGNTADSQTRPNPNDWKHSAQDPAAMVRDFTKWDDQPRSLQGFADSLVRAYKLTNTPPMEPVAIVADSGLQEMDLPDRAGLTIPKYAAATMPQGDLGALREAARMLVAAERPVIVADRLARTPAGMAMLVDLAETLGAPVVDLIGRQNFPTSHPLCQTAHSGPLIAQADVILGLEVGDFWGVVNRQHGTEPTSNSKIKPDAKTITITALDLFLKSNYQDFQRYAPVDLAISGDGEASMTPLIEAVKAALPADRKSAVAAKIETFRKTHAETYEAARQAAVFGWDASPVSTGRLCMELWQQIKAEDWALVSVGASPYFFSNWPHRLWHIDKHYQYLGAGGGGGVGYGLPAAVGAALANKALGRFSVSIQCDGDFMYANGALWTAAHHRIPLLTVMHNNRAYAQEAMNIQALTNRWNRGADRSGIGTAIDDPPIDYAKLAQAMGVYAEGPIADPKDLAAALHRAIQVVKSGKPALVDVVTQTR